MQMQASICPLDLSRGVTFAYVDTSRQSPRARSDRGAKDRPSASTSTPSAEASGKATQL